MTDKQYSTIAQSAMIDPKAVVNHPVNLAKHVEVHAFTNIGRFTFINQFSVVYGRTTMGKYCTVARNCEIGVANHPIDWLATLGNFRPYFPKHPDLGSSEHFPTIAHPPTKLGNDVWLGCGVVVRSGVTIGDGAIIAAGAVVVGDIEPYAIYGGIPAKLIRYRFETEVVEDLLRLKWWDLETSKVAALPRNDIAASISMMQGWRNQAPAASAIPDTPSAQTSDQQKASERYLSSKDSSTSVTQQS
jgi:acetyltransferase-like isoleucine patch superfamily enzyme